MKPIAWTFGMSLCFLLLIGSCSRLPGQQQTFTSDDIIGTWQADYSQYDLLDYRMLGKTVRGLDTIILEPNGIYRQDFQSDDRIISSQGQWQLEGGSVLHLKGGKLFIYGQELAESMAKGTGKWHTVDCFGHETDVDASELQLCVRADRSSPGGIILQHLQAGDPDAPITVTFYRTSQ